ncbi:hypothetical protein ARMGADRAFT_1101104 [Armillaria gallica]|uniref:Uncharacterized protein n=1 Tax=Armillaria gallica TaxID=47427 RepID=A0A2H3DJZ4_ARMGA|nr:hypothetical protein ARMGADRAFT_1101104 [Armillaria gallica]
MDALIRGGDKMVVKRERYSGDCLSISTRNRCFKRSNVQFRNEVSGEDSWWSWMRYSCIEVHEIRSRDVTNAKKMSSSGAVDGVFIEGQSALSPCSCTATCPGLHLDGLSLPRVQVCPPLSLPNYPLSQWQRAPHPSADAHPVRHRSLLFGTGDIIAQQLIEKRGLRRHDDAVETVGMEIVKRHELRGTTDSDEQKLGVTEKILGWMSHEVARYSKLSSSSWCCGIYTICIRHNLGFSEMQSWNALLGSMALLLDMISDSSRVKESLKHAALVRTRRAFRSELSLVIEALLKQAKSSDHPQRLIPLVGVAIGVLVRLRNITESPSSRLSPVLKNNILMLYSSSLLMSKHVVPTHISQMTLPRQYGPPVKKRPSGLQNAVGNKSQP